MTKRLTIALDAMGGDRAPDMVVDGAELARQRFPAVRFHMYGPSERLQPLLERLPDLARATHVHHAVARSARRHVHHRLGAAGSRAWPAPRAAREAPGRGGCRASRRAGVGDPGTVDGQGRAATVGRSPPRGTTRSHPSGPRPRSARAKARTHAAARSRRAGLPPAPKPSASSTSTR